MMDTLSRIAREWTATFDTIPDFISIISRDYTFIRVNRSLSDFLSVQPQELIGRSCYEVMHGRTSPWPECPHRRAIVEDRVVTKEICDPHAGLPLMVTCSPFHDERGQIVGSVHVARDISAQKRADEAREKLIAELQGALSQVRLLSGMLPICASCKKIRDDRGYWQQIEEYIRDHSEAEFSHGICPGCVEKLYPEMTL